MKKALLICALLCASITAGTSAHKSASKEIMGAWRVDGSTNTITFYKDSDPGVGLMALLWRPDVHDSKYRYRPDGFYFHIIAITEEEARLVSIKDEEHKCGCRCGEFFVRDSVLHIVSVSSRTDKVEHNTAHRIDSVVRIFPR